jgi:hypothetical protein
VSLDDITKPKIEEITNKAKSDFEAFLANVRGKATPLEHAIFEGVVTAAPEAAA